MEEQVSRLTAKAYITAPASRRILVGIAGTPGSGKTSLATSVVKRLNARFAAEKPGISAGITNPLAAFIPMDGYHLTRAQLSAMPDPENAHFRRGAAFTFDSAAYLKLVQELRKPLVPECRTLYAPSFDHAVKDPVDNDISITPQARVCVFEGNYLVLDEGDWKQARGLLDEAWFVEVDEDRARERLAKRHVMAGIVNTREEGIARAEGNDLVNGREIKSKRLPVDEVIQSVEDDAWKPENQK